MLRPPDRSEQENDFYDKYISMYRLYIVIYSKSSIPYRSDGISARCAETLIRNVHVNQAALKAHWWIQGSSLTGVAHS